mmetsp:Transcript_14565/g.41569  ORF Transcript_14565/g.41569 Transcript_14565/m.41569 type:complete len:290 (+) Transcript_14565:35-904(+)
MYKCTKLFAKKRNFVRFLCLFVCCLLGPLPSLSLSLGAQGRPGLQALVRLLLGHLGPRQVVVQGVADQGLHGGGEGLPVVGDREDVVGGPAEGLRLGGDHLDRDVGQGSHDVHQEARPVRGGDLQDRPDASLVLALLDLGFDGRGGPHAQGAQGLRGPPGVQEAAELLLGLRVVQHQVVDDRHADLLQALRGEDLLPRLRASDVELVLGAVHLELGLHDVQVQVLQRLGRVQQVPEVVPELDRHHRRQGVRLIVDAHLRPRYLRLVHLARHVRKHGPQHRRRRRGHRRA